MRVRGIAYGVTFLLAAALSLWFGHYVFDTNSFASTVGSGGVIFAFFILLYALLTLPIAYEDWWFEGKISDHFAEQYLLKRLR